MSNITRIKNNQVTDNTIEYQKLKDGTLVGSKFNANLTLNSNVTILGNLTVANSFAQLNSINTYINDPVVVFNNNYTGSPTYDIGMLINRNLDNLAPYGAVNAAFVWKEADSSFAAIMTTETGTTAGSINNSGFANIFVGNTYANTVTIRDTTSSVDYTTGALKVAGGVGIGGRLSVLGDIGLNGNVITGSGGLQTSVSTGYLFNETATTVKIGGAATTVSIGAATGTTTINNALVASGIVTLNSNLVAASGTNSTTNNTGALVVVGGAGIANDVNIGGYIDVDGIGRVHGNLVADSGTTSTSITTGALVVVGGTGISGNTNIGGILNVTGATNVTGAVAITDTTQSTTTNNGALTVSGGAGIAKNLNVGGDTIITGNLTVNGTQTIIGTTDLAITDSVINIHTFANLAPLTTNDGKDIGIKMHYYDYQDSHAALIRDNATGQLEWYGRGIEGSGNVFQGNAYGVIKTGEYIAANTTAATSTTTGALRVSGGAGIAGAVYIGGIEVVQGNIVAASTTESDNLTTGSFVSLGGAAIEKRLNVGGNVVLSSGTNSTSNVTGALVVSGGIGVSGNIIATGNVVFDSGVDAVGTTAGALVVKGGIAVTDGLNVGRTTRMFGNALVTSGVDSILGNLQSGSFLVTGGTSIWGNLNVGGASMFNANMIAGDDTIIKGANDNTLIWARPSNTYDQVLIGNSATVSTLVRGAKLIVNSTDSMIVPTGTNAQRPSSTGGTDVVGMFRYNTTVSALEVYDGSEWDAITTQFTVIVDEQFNGDDSTTVFNLAGSSTSAATIVSINGVIQIPTIAYTVSGDVLTFTEAPATGDLIDVRRLATTSVVTGIASTNGYMQFLVDNNGAYVYTGTSGTSPATYWTPQGAQVESTANVAASTANVLTGVDSFLSNTYRSAVYQVQVTSGTDYQVQTVTVLHDGSTATAVAHGVIQTNGNLGVFDANISGGQVYLNFVPAVSSNVLRIKKDYFLI